MPRSRRCWAPGDILSVVGRGHEGRALFATDDDRRFFTDRLARVFEDGGAELLAWSVPVNHYHLMLRVTDAGPETVFRRLNTALGMRERRRRGDQGTVFQGRYWSRPCRGDGGVTALATYVLGNPAHHGIVPTAAALETYAWTAYPEVLGRVTTGLVDARKVPAFFHPEPALAREALRAAMQARVARWHGERAGVDLCEEPGCRGARDGCALLHPRRDRRGSPRSGRAP